MNIPEIIKKRPELFDGYDGTERTPERQAAHEAYGKTLIDDAPDYIKQLMAEQQKQQS